MLNNHFIPGTVDMIAYSLWFLHIDSDLIGFTFPSSCVWVRLGETAKISKYLATPTVPGRKWDAWSF